MDILTILSYLISIVLLIIFIEWAFSKKLPFKWHEFKEGKGRESEKFLDYLTLTLNLALLSRRQSKKSDGKNEIPKYKFYTSLLIKLLKINREYGSPLKVPLEDMRKEVIKDSKFERKLGNDKNGAIFQFIFVSAVTWMFVYITEMMLSMRVSRAVLWGIFSLQAIGFGLFFIYYSKIKERIFGPFGNYFLSLYQFKSLMAVGVPIQKSLKTSSIKDLYEIKDKRFDYVNSRILLIIEKVQRQGLSISSDLSELLDEVWFIKEQSFESFIKRSIGVKFAVMALFFVTGYFIYFFALFALFLGNL